MDFLSDGKRLIVLDQRYDHHYDFLQKELEMDVSKLFYLCFLLGYTTGRKMDDYIPGKKQFRTSYLSEDQRSVIYTIAEELTDYKLLKQFNNPDLIKTSIREFQLYSSGGMEILLEDVFSAHLINNHLNPAYKNYDYDLICYLYNRLESVPF